MCVYLTFFPNLAKRNEYLIFYSFFQIRVVRNIINTQPLFQHCKASFYFSVFIPPFNRFYYKSSFLESIVVYVVNYYFFKDTDKFIVIL